MLTCHRALARVIMAAMATEVYSLHYVNTIIYLKRSVLVTYGASICDACLSSRNPDRFTTCLKLWQESHISPLITFISMLHLANHGRKADSMKSVSW